MTFLPNVLQKKTVISKGNAYYAQTRMSCCAAYVAASFLGSKSRLQIDCPLTLDTARGSWWSPHVRSEMFVTAFWIVV